MNRVILLACAGLTAITVLALSAAPTRSGTVTVTPVPAATVNGVTVGGGFIESPDRQVVRTTNNVVYIFAVDDNPCQLSGGYGVIRAYKGIGAQSVDPNVPTSFAEMDSAHHPQASSNSQTCVYAAASSTLFSPDVALDRSGVVQLAYIDPNTGNVWYQPFSTVTDTWGARTLIGTGADKVSGSGWSRAGDLALTLDANDAPHVVYATNGSSNNLRYVNKVGGAWSAPITIASGSNIMDPSLVTSLDGTIHLAYLDNSLAAHGTIKYMHYVSGAWGPIETVSAGDANVLANNDHDQSPSISTDPNGVPHVVFLDGTPNGTDDYVRDRYRVNGSWVDNTPPGGNGGPSNASGTWYAHDPGTYVSGSGDEYVFLGHDVNISPGGYEYQKGGAGNPWSPYSQLDPRNKTNTSPSTSANGLDGSVSVRFDPLRDTNPTLIDIVYYDERDGTAGYAHHATIYYKAIEIGPQVPSVQAVTPTAGATGVASTVQPTATFSTTMDPTSITTSTFTLTPQGGSSSIPASVSYNAPTSTATLAPGSALAPSTTYVATLTTGLKSSSGASLAGPVSWMFTTQAPPAPRVISQVPVAGATSVASAVVVQAQFDRPLDPGSVNGSTFTVSAGGTLVGGTVAYDDASQTASFTPSAALTASTTYTATLTSGITSSQGAQIASPVSWSFTTAAPLPPPDTTPPTVCISSPVAGAIGGTVTLAANAWDNVGVVGVQFTLDGTNLGAEDASPPFSTKWDTTTVSDGVHQIGAIARDAAGNVAFAQTTSVTVNNAGC